MAISGEGLGQFPLGQTVRELRQVDRAPKELFVLGVYASAVHARWLGPDGRELVKALAVASEPHIFWRGEESARIVAEIAVPAGAGSLVAADQSFNGPSGVVLDELFLSPLGRSRAHAWLADLVPHSCKNPQQDAAIDRAYAPLVERGLVPAASVPEVPSVLAGPVRQDDIAEEVAQSRAEILLLLGDQPIRWFLSRWDSGHRDLASFGTDEGSYGRLHPVTVAGRSIQVLPLAHPRQVARLGRSSERWFKLHEDWRKEVAPVLLDPVRRRAEVHG